MNRRVVREVREGLTPVNNDSMTTGVSSMELSGAVLAIKTAILQSQGRAASRRAASPPCEAQRLGWKMNPRVIIS